MSGVLIENEEILDPQCFQWRYHADRVLKRSKYFYENNQLCDVILIAGNDGERVPAHRLVLSTTSDYFLAMFTSSMRESKDYEVTMNEMNGKTLQNIVKYCYTGSIEVEQNTVEALLVTASMLQLESIVNTCNRFLERQIDASNCLGVASIADQLNCRSLFESAQNYALQNFHKVCKEQEFFELSAKRLAELLKSDYLNVSREEDVFTNFMAWVRYDEEKRKIDVPQLLPLVRLVLLKPSFIVDQVISICRENGCMDMLTDIFKWHMVPERRGEFSFDHNTMQRKSTIGRLLAIGGTKIEAKFRISIEMYCPVFQKWTMWQSIHSEHNQFGSALIGSKVYFVGGRLRFKTTNFVQSLDIVSLTLSSLPSLLTHRRDLCVAALNGLLYAIGGHDGLNYLQTVERYDPNERIWSHVASMNIKRANAGVAVCNGRLYVLGGEDGLEIHASIECYDWYTNKWSVLEPMILQRSCLGVATVNGYIYAVGGQCGNIQSSEQRTKSIEFYDLKQNRWRLVGGLLSKNCDQVRCASFGDCLVVVGGHDGTLHQKSVMEYDHIHCRMNIMAPLLIPRSGADVVVIPNIGPTKHLHIQKAVKYISYKYIISDLPAP